MSLLKTIFKPPFFKVKIDFISSSGKKYSFIETKKLKIRSRILCYSLNDFNMFIHIEYNDYLKTNTVLCVLDYKNIVFFKNTTKTEQLLTGNYIIGKIDYFEYVINIDNKMLDIVFNYFYNYAKKHNYSNESFVNLKIAKNNIFIFSFLVNNDEGNKVIIHKSFFMYENICWCHEELLAIEKLININRQKIKHDDFEFIFYKTMHFLPNEIAIASFNVSTYRNASHLYHDISFRNDSLAFKFIFLIDIHNNFTFKIYKIDSNIPNIFNPFMNEIPDESYLYFQSIGKQKLIQKPYSQYSIFNKYEINDSVGELISELLMTYFVSPNILNDLDLTIPLNDQQIEIVKLSQY